MPHFVTNVAARLLGFYINTLSYIAPQRATMLAYRFFSQPMYGRLKNNDLPIILREATLENFHFKEHAFTTYTWPGNATKVLLVHGWESNSARWKLLISYLRKAGCTIIAVDAPAHGLSSGKEFTIPRYAEYINIVANKYQPHYLIGHSLGGATALYYQAHYKNPFIQKMVILGAPSEFNSIVNNYRNMLGMSKRVYSRFKTYCENLYNMNLSEFSGAGFASKINVPGLVVHDHNDETVAFKEGKLIAAAYPGSKFIATKGMGHRLHDDKMYQRVYAFLFNEEEVSNEEIA